MNAVSFVHIDVQISASNQHRRMMSLIVRSCNHGTQKKKKKKSGRRWTELVRARTRLKAVLMASDFKGKAVKLNVKELQGQIHRLLLSAAQVTLERARTYLYSS